MSRSILLKLALAFWLISLVGVALVAFFALRITASEFDQFLTNQDQAEAADALADYYETNGGWQGAQTVLAAFDAEPGPGRGSHTFAVANEDGRIVVPGSGLRTDTVVPPRLLTAGLPIEVNGQTVGTLIAPQQNNAQQQRLRGEQSNFLARINIAVFWAALGATAVSLILGVWMARTLTRPIQALTAATQAVARGDLGRQVVVRGEDELGQLAVAFNQMSSDLSTAQAQRRQMTADIAHDLRTPLSLILGHSEALSDGVLPPTPETLHVIHDEAQRLNRLIDDLRTLSLSETGALPLQARPVAPAELLARTVTAHTPAAQQKGVTLAIHANGDLPDVHADPDRIAQVLDNLVQNGLRYTPAGGAITLSAEQNDDHVLLTVADSGPGIAPEDLPYVFQRFYRADKARQRQEGGSGLGLAIAKSLIAQHNGRLWVESAPGAGATFKLTLPVAGKD